MNSYNKCFVQNMSTSVMMARYGYAVHVTVPYPVQTKANNLQLDNIPDGTVHSECP